MKKIRNLVIGGIENKVINLVLLTVFLIVLAFLIVIHHQSKQLAELIVDTNQKQQASMEMISSSAMRGVMENTMNRNAKMQADLADEMFCSVKDDIRAIADYATKLYADPEAYPKIPVEQATDFSGQVNVATWLYAEGLDPASETVSEEAERLGNMKEMMLSVLDHSKYLGACYIATPSGLTLMCDDAAASRESADAGFVFDSRPRPWYVGAERTGSRYFTGIERDFYTDRIGIVCSVPVFHEGKLAAVVGGDLFLDVMEKAVADSESENGFMFIADDDGHVIFSPKKEGILQVVPEASAVDLRSPEYGNLSQVVTNALNGKKDIILVDLEDQACYMTGAPIKTVGWAVIAAAYQDVVEQPAKQLQTYHEDIRTQATETYRREIAASKRILILMLLILGTLTLLNAMLLGRRIVRPLNRMTRRIAVLTGENPVFEMSDEYKSGDEIEVLAKSFADLSTRTREYMEENLRITAEKERIGAELNVATRIQADMLPQIFPAFPERKDFDLYASMDPAKEVGGDFYDFFLIDEDHLAMVLADVSGKGVPAALFMVVTKTLIKNRAKMGGSPAEILSDVNRELSESNTSGLFVTVWMAILQLSTGKGMAANAGHEHPALRHKDGDFVLVEYKHSPPLGLLEEVPVFEHVFQLEKGDVLFVYTDGVTEATQKGKKMFGVQRMLEALNQKRGAAPKEVLEHMTEQIVGFVGEADQFDDITMLSFAYYGTQE